MKLKKRLLLSYFSITLMIIIVAATAWVTFNKLSYNSERMSNEYVPLMNDAKEVRIHMDKVYSMTIEWSIGYVDGNVKENISNTIADTCKIIDDMTKLSKSEEMIALSKQLKDGVRSFNGATYKMIDNNGRDIGAIAPNYNKVIDLSEEMEKIAYQNILIGDEIIRGYFQKGKWIIGLTTLASFIIALYIGMRQANNITKPIDRLTEISQQLAKGKMDLDINIKSKDEIGVLAENFKYLKGIINSLGHEIDFISESVQKGNLYKRGDINKFENGFSKIIGKVNTSISNLLNIVDDIPTTVMFINKDYEITFLNKKGLEIMGFSIENIIGVPCYEILNSKDGDHNRCSLIKDIIENGLEIEKELNLDLKGQEMNILLNGIPIRDDNEEVIGSLITLINQTEIKNAVKEAKIKTEEIEKQVAIQNKRAQFQKIEVNKLITNLAKLSKGDLELEFYEIEYDSDTKEIAEDFNKINNSLEISIDFIKNYITEISYVLSEISRANLDVQIYKEYKGDFTTIKEATNNIVQSLNEMVSNINEASNQVNNNANQVADNSNLLSKSTVEQSKASEELQASILEVSTQTYKNGNNAEKAKELTKKTKEDALIGNKEMNNMLSSMESIDEASKSISNIIEVIEEIALQTNLLAFNAAVEAARAGEKGKGFSVVAQEIRKLALKSSEAAKETTSLIETTISRVNQGKSIAINTSKSFEKIVLDITQSSQLVNDIFLASNEQTKAIEQINNSIKENTTIIQKNSIAAQQSAATSEELLSEAEILKNLVNRFKTNSNLFKPAF